MSQKELQQKMFEYQVLEENFKQLNQRRDLFTMKLMEIEQTNQAIGELEKSKADDVFLPIGSSVFLPCKVNKNEKMIVSIGADLALEKDLTEAKKILEERRKTIENGLENVQMDMLRIANRMRVLEPEIQEMISKTEKAG